MPNDGNSEAELKQFVNMKKYFILLLLTFSMNCIAQISGYGTNENPYLISSVEELSFMRDMINSGDESYCNAYYKQTCNIVINESLDNIDLVWEPVSSFSGVYDGGYFYIKGVYINNNSDNQALFGINRGVIKNLGLIGSCIIANDMVGGIVGENLGEISFCYNESQISGKTYVGGICGYNRMHIQYCYNLGCIEGLRCVGGIDGANVIMTDSNANEIENSAVIKNCYNAGNVKGNEYASGISAMENFSTLENCYNIGFVDNGYPVAQGYYNSYKLFYDKSLVVTTAIDSRAEGFVTVDMIDVNLFDDDNWEYNEELYPQISCIKTDKSLLYATPIFLTEGQNVKNILSDFKVSTKNGVEWSCKNGLVEISDDGNVKILSYGEDVLLAQLGEYVREIPMTIVYEPNIDGVGTRANPYKIANAEEFIEVVKLINSGEPYNKMCYKVTGNLVFNRNLLDKINNNQFDEIVTCESINSFAGVFDFNMFFVEEYYSSQPLFKNNDGEISGIYMVNSYITGGNNTAAICSENKGLIRSCIIKNSFLKGGDNTAGICSINKGEINTCWNQANVIGKSFNTGGISAYNNYGKIVNCRNDGSINGEIHVGGICSRNIGSIVHCINKGNLICKNSEYIGGIAASSAIGKITYCVNSGCLQGPSMVAGIVAYTNFSDVTDCYNIGTVSGFNNSSDVAAIIVQKLGALENCFYDNQTTGVGDTYAKGLSTVEFTNGNVFNDSDNWYEEKGVYPQFASGYLSIPDIYPIFLSKNETVNDIKTDFIVNTNVSYRTKNNRILFDKCGNATIYSVGYDTIVVDNSWIIPIKILENPNEILETNRYYSFRNENSQYLSATNTLGLSENENSSTIFYLSEDNTLLSYNNGKYINKNAEFDEIGNKGIAVNIEEGTIENSIFVGISQNNYLGSEDGDIVLTESNWIVKEINSIPVHITSAGYASFYAPLEVTLPKGVEAYYITKEGVKSGFVSMEPVLNNVIPANSAVVLKATNAGIYNFEISETGAMSLNGNLLVGTIATEYKAEDAYILSFIEEEGVGLRKAMLNKLNNTAFQNNTHKAYLPITSLSTEASKSNTFRFVFGDETAINDVKGENGNVKAIYDLQGRRVENPTKGIYIINGKKVLVK